MQNDNIKNERKAYFIPCDMRRKVDSMQDISWQIHSGKRQGLNFVRKKYDKIDTRRNRKLSNPCLLIGCYSNFP